MMRQMLGIYIHVPFCKQKCAYCDFYSQGGAPESRMDSYCQAVKTHFSEYFRVGGNNWDVDSIYFGGGTPSLLGAKRLCGLLGQLDKLVDINKNAEITVECNPESTDYKLAKKLARAGVNRISLGVQSARDEELCALGRLHTFAQAKEAVAQVRKAGIQNISLDLMYALPHQTMEEWLYSLDAIIDLAPQHISAYALKLEAGTPLYAQNPQLPTEDEQADFYLQAVERLAAAGYEQYEISNFALPGYRARHNSKYWDLSQYLGFGPGAHSFFGGRRFSFVADLEGYLQGVAGQGDLLAEADELASFQRPGEYIMLKLRTTDGVEEEDFYRRFHQEFASYAQRLQKYLEPGLCCHKDGRWWLTPKGLLVSNSILADLLENTEL